jgi:2-keto-4-pentenoate hydratase/2-oxohepta-3-ene-1,7-dioic acid hydratase in catechol pathway
MKLATLDTYWGQRLAVVLGDNLVDLSAGYAARLHQDRGESRAYASAQAAREMPSDVHELLLAGTDALARAAELAAWLADVSARDPERLAGFRWPVGALPFAPAVPRPSKIWCAGANYGAHKREMAARTGTPPPPDRQRGFLKPPSALIGPFEPIVLPPESQHVDHEIELGVVIGRRGRRVAEEAAMDHVAGYVLFDDVSSRDLPVLDQGRMDRGKGFDTFAVMGPWLVTKDEVPDPHNLTLGLRVNGELRQDGNTSDMVFGIEAQIGWLSAAMTLEPGDVLTTGTPSGVSPIAVGDVLEGWVERVGHHRNEVVADPHADQIDPGRYGVPRGAPAESPTGT